MNNVFRYDHSLCADVSIGKLPLAAGVVKNYLASRLYSDAERQESPVDYLDRVLKSLPAAIADSVNLNLLLTKREMAHQVHDRAVAQIASIPDNASFHGEIDITRGYRPANVAAVDIFAQRRKARIEVFFKGTSGDDTWPLYWMQYDALLTRAEHAGFTVDKTKLNGTVAAFAYTTDSYFRKCLHDAMSCFDWSELEAAVHFLWPHGLPDDVKKQIGK